MAAGRRDSPAPGLKKAKSELSGLDPKWQKPIMLLYWGALYLISWAFWLI